MSVYEEGELLTKEQVFDTNVDNRWKYLPTGWHYDEEGKCCRIHETMYLYSDEAFWGFGEKFTDLNKRRTAAALLAEGCAVHKHRGFLQGTSVFYQQQGLCRSHEYLYPLFL